MCSVRSWRISSMTVRTSHPVGFVEACAVAKLASCGQNQRLSRTNSGQAIHAGAPRYGVNAVQRVGSQSDNAHPPGENPGRRSNKNRVDPPIGESSEGGVKVVFRRCGPCIQSQAETACGWLNVLAGRFRVKNKSDRPHCRDQVAQELQPFSLVSR
jgi:hypothetical protein